MPMSNLPPLNTETIWAILNDEVDDATVNQLVWHCLGYLRRGNWLGTRRTLHQNGGMSIHRRTLLTVVQRR